MVYKCVHGRRNFLNVARERVNYYLSVVVPVRPVNAFPVGCVPYCPVDGTVFNCMLVLEN